MSINKEGRGEWKAILSPRLRNRVKISHLSQIFNLGKIKRRQPHSVVDRCRE